MKKTFTNYYLIFFLFFFILWFLWFNIRPSSIRKQCVKKVKELSREKKEMEEILSNFQANNVYRTCLSEKGLKPEDLVKFLE